MTITKGYLAIHSCGGYNLDPSKWERKQYLSETDIVDESDKAKLYYTRQDALDAILHFITSNSDSKLNRVHNAFWTIAEAALPKDFTIKFNLNE